MAACDARLFDAYANWYRMHAQLEGMPDEQWEALANGQRDAAQFPEVQESIRLLRDAAEQFRQGAEGTEELLNEPAQLTVRGQRMEGRARDKVRASIEYNLQGWRELAERVDEMAAMLEKAEAPSIEQVQGIEEVMKRQHDVADQRSRDLRLLDEVRR
jgi:hypothetical protein